MPICRILFDVLDKRGSCLCHVCKDLSRQLSACQQSIEISSDSVCLKEFRDRRQRKSAVSEICSLTGVGCIYNSASSRGMRAVHPP